MIRLTALAGTLAALTLFAGCSSEMREKAAPEPVVFEAEPSALGPAQDCRIGDDDGIGGTGCEID